MLYDGVIDENSISLNDTKECIKNHTKEFKELCEELQDVLISDREQAAFYLTINFINF